MTRGAVWDGRLTRLRELVDDLVAADIGDLDVAQAARLHRDLRVATDRIGAVGARLLARVEADGRWTAGGERTFGQWVAGRELSSVGSARRTAELGRALDGELPATAAAVGAGRMSLEHAQVLARVAATSPTRRAALASGGAGRDERSFVVRAGQVPVDRSRREVERWAAAVDAEAAERSHEVACAKEHLTVARRADGLALQGFVTREHGKVLLTALRAVAGVPAAGDGRSREQRQAAALTDLARLVLDRGLAGAGSQVRPHLSVHVSWETVRRLAMEDVAERATDGGSAASSEPEPSGTGTSGTGMIGTGMIGTGTSRTGTSGAEPATFDDGTPLPPSVLARLLCDSEISRIVFGPTGEVLDVGRSQRTFVGQLRRAVVARDRTCRYPGCDAPPNLGEVHHLTYWSHGGRTSVSNGVLLCWFHHDLVHRRRLDLRRGPGGEWTVTRPGGSAQTSGAGSGPGSGPPANPAARAGPDFGTGAGSGSGTGAGSGAGSGAVAPLPQQPTLLLSG
ncbi:MAG TPA: DUF222 domain-containing protein [Actinotalea sp.]|nr:DUF222 domain-containing protein [Actinotalea sp.]